MCGFLISKIPIQTLTWGKVKGQLTWSEGWKGEQRRVWEYISLSYSYRPENNHHELGKERACVLSLWFSLRETGLPSRAVWQWWDQPIHGVAQVTPPTSHSGHGSAASSSARHPVLAWVGRVLNQLHWLCLPRQGLDGRLLSSHLHVREPFPIPSTLNPFPGKMVSISSLRKKWYL